jgi:protease-4
VAASGGYYIAAAADAIVAQPGSLTGSIGVYGGKLNVLGLYRKLGLNVEGVTRGRRAEMLSPYRDFSPDERKVFERQMEEFYRQFVAKAAHGRGLDEAAVDSAGGGRVWSGWAARDLGLVDELGGLPAALRLAREKAGIDAEREVQVMVYPRVERTLLERLLAQLVREDEDEDAYAWLPAPLRSWLAAAELPFGAPWALMPYRIEFR